METAAVDDEAARAWLDAVAASEAGEAVAESLHVLNFAIRAHRAACADPVVREVARSQALTIRVGYGEGVEVAEGAWTAARDLPAEPSRPHHRNCGPASALRPQERFAALLGGRDAVLACEELALRARLDLDERRPREAALQTHLALEAAVAELAAFRDQDTVASRLADLEALREPLARAANEALQRGPADATVATVTDALAQIEAILRARAASATY